MSTTLRIAAPGAVLSCALAALARAGDPACDTMLLAAEPHEISTTIDQGKISVPGDLDGDGDVDIATVAFAADTVTWFENDGAPSPAFTPHVVATANGPQGLALADVNGDGALDIVYSVWFEDVVRWIENDGAATPSFTEHEVDADANGVEGVAAADLDGDGDMDLLSAISFADTCAWYENNGAKPPAFTKHVIDTAADLARHVTAADVNGDGAMDVLGASSSDNTVAWYDGAAAFAKHVVTSAAMNVRDVQVADLDGDGDLDLLSASVSDDTLAWYENDGALAPTFTTHVVTATADGAAASGAVDLDGDGDLDLLCASLLDDSVRWFASDGANPPTFSESLVTNHADSAEDVAAADIDGDGDPDLVVTSSTDDAIRWFEMGVPVFGVCCLADGTCVEDTCLSDCATQLGWAWNANGSCLDITCPGQGNPAAFLVEALDYQRFKDTIAYLASYGTRFWNRPQNEEALAWLAAELASYGYDNVTLDPYEFQGVQKHNVYATKVGTTDPGHMYILGAHMDTFNKLDDYDHAPGADDDGSGVSSVLEMARVFAQAETDVSVRFVLWNNEETGLNGAEAYVASHFDLQGTPDEPIWLGMIQQDMILFDHGPGPVPDADVEYQRAEWNDGHAALLAAFVAGAMSRYGDGSFPAEVGDNMGFTDSVPFSPRIAAISVRENQRIAEIGEGSNPHWHHATDLPSAYTGDDYRLGFNILSMICGAIGELSGAQPLPCTGDATGDGTVDVTDLLAVLAEWNCEADCAADVTGDDRVDVSDLLAVLSGWGSC